MTKLDNLIDRIKLAGRQTAESWLGSAAPESQAYEARVHGMTACLSSIILAPAITAPVLLMTFSWPHAIAGALAAAAMPVAVAGLLAATGSTAFAGRTALVAVAAALSVLVLFSGGLSSPFLPLLALLPLESAMQSRRLQGLLLGLLSAGGALLAVTALAAVGNVVPVPSGAAPAAGLAFALYVLVRGLVLVFNRPVAVAVVTEADAEEPSLC